MHTGFMYHAFGIREQEYSGVRYEDKGAVKFINDAPDEIGRNVYREEKDLNKRNILKGTRRLLLCKDKDIFDGTFKSGSETP
jgi:hypothetical protein